MMESNNSQTTTANILSGFRGWKLVNKIWLVFSIPFILYIAWQFLQQTVYKKGVANGTERAAEIIYTDIINKASNVECNTIFVERSGRRVDLINVKCLNQAQPSNETSTPQTLDTQGVNPPSLNDEDDKLINDLPDITSEFDDSLSDEEIE